MSGTTHGQFDDLSSLYEDMASWPFRKEIETPSVLETLGDVRGKDVLDFGCGDGTYSRILKRLGARRVVGFDVADGISPTGSSVTARTHWVLSKCDLMQSGNKEVLQETR
ncbi:MAG TPA: methyltransferase domain-containing protein [Niabella sp.]|nr:methyltransferase domain-containing protein [Cellvibrio sp.]HTG56359.1 methyltransferase domain-containing protein [Niabella sp.]